MKHQLQTIREFIESAHEGEWASYVDRDAALTALAELEAMAGEQEPVAWAVYWGLPPTRKKSVHFDKESAQAVANQIKSATEVRPLYTTPPAQQPQARPDFNDEWAGYLKDGETPFERFLRERKDLNALTKLYQRALEENERLKVQQHVPEAGCGDIDWKHPKIQALIGADARNRIVIDLIWQILKDPEGDFSAMDMEYWDSIHDAVREAVIDAQQPQAEPFGYVSQHTNGSWEFSPTPAGVYPDTAKSITAVYTKQPQAEAVPDCGEAGHDEGCCGNRDCLPSARKKAPKQAEAVPQTKQALADALYALQVPHVACQDGLVTRCMCRKCVIKRGDEALAAPQQAEVGPKDHPLYVFATEVIHGAYRYTELPAKARAAIDAAMAQGEKP